MSLDRVCVWTASTGPSMNGGGILWLVEVVLSQELNVGWVTGGIISGLWLPLVTFMLADG